MADDFSATPPAPIEWTSSSRGRIASLDIIRGAVMVLMAIDHVRVYAGVPPGGPTPGVFFTRWITHFCAPAFVFLAGTAAFLYGERMASTPRLARFLVTRGLWLIVLELTVLRVAWTFNLRFEEYLLTGVIWMIGWCMILLAGLIRLPLGAIGTIGGVLVGLHNLTDLVSREAVQGLLGSSFGWFWKLLYFGGTIPLGGDGPGVVVLYSIVPWIGVMALGYVFAPVFRMPPVERRRLCLRIGLGAVVLFLVLRSFNLYGDPRPWSATERMPGWLAFLNTAKYPASLLFLLMTLGPTIALIPLLERARATAANVLSVFGRVPFFYYVLHIPLIHVLALIVARVRTPDAVWWLFENHPAGVGMPPPDGYPWSLPLLYGVFLIAVALLYVPCRWFADVKARRKDAWLSYL